MALSGIALSTTQYRVCTSGDDFIVNYCDESNDPAYEQVAEAGVADAFRATGCSHVSLLKLHQTFGNVRAHGDAMTRIRSFLIASVIKPALERFPGQPITVVECVEELQLLLAAKGLDLLDSLTDGIIEHIRDIHGSVDVSQSYWTSERVEWRGAVADTPAGPWRLAEPQALALRSLRIPPASRYELRGLLRALRRYAWIAADQSGYKSNLSKLARLDAPGVDIRACWSSGHSAAIRALTAALVGSEVWSLPCDPRRELLISATADSTGCSALFSQWSQPASSASAGLVKRALSAFSRHWHQPSVRGWSDTAMAAQAQYWAVCRLAGEHYPKARRLVLEVDDATQEELELSTDARVKRWTAAVRAAGAVIRAPSTRPPAVDDGTDFDDDEAAAGGAGSGGAAKGGAGGPKPGASLRAYGHGEGEEYGSAGAAAGGAGGPPASPFAAAIPPRVSVRLSLVDRIELKDTIFVKFALPKVDASWRFLPTRHGALSADGLLWGMHTSKASALKLSTDGRPDPRAVSAAATQILNFAAAVKQLPVHGDGVLPREVQAFFTSKIDEWARRHSFLVKDFPVPDASSSASAAAGGGRLAGGAGSSSKWSNRKDIVAVLGGMVLFVHEHGLSPEDALASDAIAWTLPALPSSSSASSASSASGSSSAVSSITPAEVHDAEIALFRSMRDALRCLHYNHVTRRDVRIQVMERLLIALPPPIEAAVRTRAGLEELFLPCEAGATRAQYVCYEAVTLSKLQELIRDEATKYYCGVSTAYLSPKSASSAAAAVPATASSAAATATPTYPKAVVQVGGAAFAAATGKAVASALGSGWDEPRSKSAAAAAAPSGAAVSSAAAFAAAANKAFPSSSSSSAASKASSSAASSAPCAARAPKRAAPAPSTSASASSAIRFANPALNGPPCMFCAGDHTMSECPRLRNGRMADEGNDGDDDDDGNNEDDGDDGNDAPKAAAAPAAAAAGTPCPKGINCVTVGCPMKHPAVIDLD